VVADAQVVGGRLPDWISLGVLAGSVPREVVDEAVAVTGKQARRSDGKLPPHVMVYFAMALALFADDDYEEVAVRLSETLESWGCWDSEWSTPISGGITSARQRLGSGADGRGVRPGRGAGRRRVDPGRVSRAVAVDEYRRDRVGHPGHAGECGRVRVSRFGG
jgi:hypothetical protein